MFGTASTVTCFITKVCHNDKKTLLASFGILLPINRSLFSTKFCYEGFKSHFQQRLQNVGVIFEKFV